MRLLISLVVMALLIPNADALCQAKMDDCSFKVTIHAAFTGDGASDAYMARAKNAVESKWNGFKVGECQCKFEVTVLTKKVDNCDEAESSDPTYYCITVHTTRGVHRSNAYRTDFTRGLSDTVAETSSGPCQFEVHDSDTTIAHEFGHVMGLHDEYTDMYKYNVVDANGNVVSGPHTITPADWTAKGWNITHSLPTGQKVQFVPGGYGSWLHSVPNADAGENNIMANVGPNSTVKQKHVDAIFKQTRFECPDKCCCGNKKVDADKREECDYLLSPSGCADHYTCTKECKCKKTWECGDGKISGPEECDPDADPIGCGANEECEGCKCEQADPVLEPPRESMVHFTIDNPVSGMPIMTPEPVHLGFNDPGMVVSIEYYMDGDLEFQTEDPGFIWFIEPELYDEGEHTLTVAAHDIEDLEITEEVSFFVEHME